ncbi:MAG: DUF1501 domain-containing protein [Planctomycetales bacterium]|nr:DUF1501 domain-containing protein [Planctomycetales bacterium]
MRTTYPWVSSDNPLRRQFMAMAAKRLLGVSCAGALAGKSLEAIAQAAQAESPAGKAKSVILLYMSGAMSHLDTLDPKPGTSSAGETTTRQTQLAGVSITDKMPKLAYLMNRIALVRSMTTETGAHEQGNYLMHTSYKPLNSIRHPGLGAWANHVFDGGSGKLPGNVLVGSAAGHPGAGFLPATIAPVPIPNAQAGLTNTVGPSYVTEDQFRRRMVLSRKFDSDFRNAYNSHLVEAYDQTYVEAVKLMGSTELKAFDIKQEKEEVRDFYGATKIGQGCLLARRLVQRGVRFVEVEFGGWDHHNDLYDRLPKMVGELDDAVGALLYDLIQQGMLNEVLVVLTTEFGRTPDINENRGRDHHPGAFSAFFCGAGIRGGGVYGKSDARGHSVDEDPVYPADFNATIAAAMGLPLKQEFVAPNGRPFRICNEGSPITSILA